MGARTISWPLLAALLLGAAPEGLAPGSDGYSLDVPSLGLRFTTPANWVLSNQSKADELLLVASPKKSTPLLRIRSFAGRLSAEDRLPAMRRSLPEGESQVSFVSSVKWDQGGRLYETARAVFKSGTREWHALFTVIDQPKKLQHGFWLYGKKKDLDKHWAAIQTSIASAKSIPGKGQARPEESVEASSRKRDNKPVWKDARSGLQLASWPAGFALDGASAKALHRDGLVLRPLDEHARRTTLIRLTARAEQADEAAKETATALETSLKSNPSVEDVRMVPLRVGGSPAFMLRWIASATSGDETLHETYLVQKQSTLFKVEFSAPLLWARARSRRTLVKDFIAGIGLR